jgi:tetratricopeptide (TPR) repeat protein
LYRDKGELERALKSHESALALAHEIGYRLGVATELGNIGLVLVSRRMFERAAPYLAESIAFFLADGVANGIRQGLYGLSRCDDSLGRERLQGLLKAAGLAEENIADMLDRIDLLRSRRPWQRDRQRNPFAPPAQ